MTFLTNPAIFNYVILTLYVLSSLRWAYAGSWGNALYWGCAFGITYSVTFMMEGK